MKNKKLRTCLSLLLCVLILSMAVVPPEPAHAIAVVDDAVYLLLGTILIGGGLVVADQSGLDTAIAGFYESLPAEFKDALADSANITKYLVNGFTLSDFGTDALAAVKNYFANLSVSSEIDATTGFSPVSITPSITFTPASIPTSGINQFYYLDGRYRFDIDINGRITVYRMYNGAYRKGYGCGIPNYNCTFFYMTFSFGYGPLDSDCPNQLTLLYTESYIDHKIDEHMIVNTAVWDPGFFFPIDNALPTTYGNSTFFPTATGADALQADTGLKAPALPGQLIGAGAGAVRGDVTAPPIDPPIDPPADQTWPFKIPILGDILSALKAIISAIAGFFDVSKFDLDLSPLKVKLSSVFPFCIPFDFKNVISAFSAQPTDFQFKIDLDTSYFSVHHIVDLSPFRIPILFFRYIVIATFCIILMTKTKEYMKW